MNDPLFHALNAIREDLKFVSRLVHLQHAEIAALRAYTIEHIAELGGTAKKQEFDDMSKRTREAYNKFVEHLEETHPALAAHIDMREQLDASLQDAWYFPSQTPPPSKDVPPDAGPRE